MLEAMADCDVWQLNLELLPLQPSRTRAIAIHLIYLNICVFVAAPVQLIGMSATLLNSDELSTFLKGSVYQNNFRPVKLDEYVKVNEYIYKLNLQADEMLVKERTLYYSVCKLCVNTV